MIDRAPLRDLTLARQVRRSAFFACYLSRRQSELGLQKFVAMIPKPIAGIIPGQNEKNCESAAIIVLWRQC